MQECHLDCEFVLLCRSLGILTEHNAIRRFCMAVITNVYFEGCILLLVLLSSILLALDSPSLDDSSPVGRAISAGDINFVVCFTLEMCLKVGHQQVVTTAMTITTRRMTLQNNVHSRRCA